MNITWMHTLGKASHALTAGRSAVCGTPINGELLADGTRQCKRCVAILARQSERETVSVAVEADATYMAERAARLERESAAAATYAATAERRDRLAWSNVINRQVRENYRPVASADGAEFWRAIEARTAGESEAGFRGWTRSVLVSHAGEAYGTLTGDHARVATILDDVVQNARELAFNRLLEVSQDETATACAGGCGKTECALELESAYGVTTLTLSGASVIGWHTVRAVKCGACVACIGKRGVRFCDAPTTRDEWLAVGRVIGGALKTASRNALKRDKTQGVEWFSGSADEFGFSELVSAEMRAHDVDGPVTRALPADALALARKISEAADIAREPVIAANGAVSQFAGNAAAIALGYAQTERGRRSARAALQSSADTGKVVRTGTARTRTLTGADRAVSRSGLKLGAPVEVFTVTVRGTRDPRVAPKAL